MDAPEVNRRKFNELLAGAFGGLVVGASLGCTGDAGKGGSAGASAAGGSAAAKGETALAGEKHACRGLNDCKGLGTGGSNACAGQGMLALRRLTPPSVCGGIRLNPMRTAMSRVTVGFSGSLR